MANGTNIFQMLLVLLKLLSILCVYIADYTFSTVLIKESYYYYYYYYPREDVTRMIRGN